MSHPLTIPVPLTLSPSLECSLHHRRTQHARESPSHYPCTPHPLTLTGVQPAPQTHTARTCHPLTIPVPLTLSPSLECSLRHRHTQHARESPSHYPCTPHPLTLTGVQPAPQTHTARTCHPLTIPVPLTLSPSLECSLRHRRTQHARESPSHYPCTPHPLTLTGVQPAPQTHTART